jgi:nitric oxide reductase subunit B
VVHAIYDAGTHRMKATNQPAFYWMLAEAFGNFLGAGVWGFMITLPQINLYAHGTQWTVSHGHFAFWGAYACGILSVIYLALQKVRGLAAVDGALWKWSFAALNIGMIGMVGGLLVSGVAQEFVERAIGGSTHAAFIAGQENQWFVEGMVTRVVFGLVFAAGYVALVWDLAALGKRLPVLATLKAAE